MAGRLRILWILLLAMPLAGCFSERSFPMRPERLVAVLPAQVTSSGGHGERMAAREWVAAVHPLLAERLPWMKADEPAAVISGNLRDERGGVIDIYRHFGLDEGELDSLWCNFQGLEQTAQVASPSPPQPPAPCRNLPAPAPSTPPRYPPDTPPTPPSSNPSATATVPKHVWNGFHEVDVPVGQGKDSLQLFGRLGAPDPAKEIPGSYIVITHGLFGSLDGLDMENQAEALRRAGHHVLAIEMRGHGITGARYPQDSVTFGICEAGDLLEVAHWLKTQRHATRVGLVSFSLSGMESLLAAWQDGATLDAADAQRPVCKYVCMPEAEAAYNGGMFLVSVPVDISATEGRFEKRWGLFEAPCKALFEQHVEDRLRSFGDPPAHGVWDFVAAELRRDGWVKAYGSEEKLRKDVQWYTDFHADGWGVGVRRLECVRNPILMLSAANDPLGTAQGVAELFARVKNPNIGMIMLKEGGHMGFPALSADYYYSLMLAFFDPATGPRAVGRLNHDEATAQRD